MAIPLGVAELLGPIFGAMMYGIHIVTFGVALRKLLTTQSGRWKRGSEIKWIMVVVSCLLFIIATLDLVMAIITIVQAFVLYTGPGGADHIFTHSAGYQTMTKSFCVGFQSLLGDAILIYRCWFLWNRSWLVITLPLLIWLGNIATVVRFLDLLAEATQGLIISSAVQPWVQAFWALTISVNVMTTSLIVGRIWMVDRQNKKLGIDINRPQTTLGHAMRNIIESGMIYTVVSIFALVTEILGSNLTYPASHLEIHSVGITFNLIIIRASGMTRFLQSTSASASMPLHIHRHTTTTVGREGTDLFSLSRLDKESQLTKTLEQSDMEIPRP
ncbi:Carboxylic ester hydrolase [Mycena venus]|uniref:Carboxylic ester hydrolase n=1 Tax=Mycena venus TaxID=2733690 RepID=A0A8H6YBD9_9AGAR|nr:Carboxylic ester hydrolase [Mycena venus]